MAFAHNRCVRHCNLQPEGSDIYSESVLGRSAGSIVQGQTKPERRCDLGGQRHGRRLGALGGAAAVDVVVIIALGRHGPRPLSRSLAKSLPVDVPRRSRLGSGLKPLRVATIVTAVVLVAALSPVPSYGWARADDTAFQHNDVISAGGCDLRAASRWLREYLAKEKERYVMSQVFPFIVGCARSGTTLLRAMLDSHSELVVTPESGFVVPVIGARHRLESVHGLAVDTFLEYVAADGTFALWGLKHDAVAETLKRNRPANVIEGLRQLYSLYAESRGKKRVADKTPNNVVCIARLAEAFPEARFIHIIRDGRDVAASLTSMAFGPTSFGKSVLHWKKYVQTGQRQGLGLGANRYYEVRYEDVVERPDRTLRDLCDFINLRYEPDMLQFYERADQVLKGVGRPSEHPSIHQPVTKGLRDWRRQLRPADIALFEALAGDFARTLGYDSGVEHVSSQARMRASGWRARSYARRAAGITWRLISGQQVMWRGYP